MTPSLGRSRGTLPPAGRGHIRGSRPASRGGLPTLRRSFDRLEGDGPADEAEAALLRQPRTRRAAVLRAVGPGDPGAADRRFARLKVAAVELEDVDAAGEVERVDDLAGRVGRREEHRPRLALRRGPVADLADVRRVADVEEARALLVPAAGDDAVAVVEVVRRAQARDRGPAAPLDERVELGLVAVEQTELLRAAAGLLGGHAPGLELA